MRKLILSSSFALLLPVCALAQTSAAPTAGAMSAGTVKPHLSSHDKNFITKAAAAGMAEVQDGQIAETKGDSAVQAIGRRMVADHGKANQQLSGIASTKGVAPPQAVDAKAAAMTDRLQGLSGAAFDTAYLKGQKKAHLQAIKLFSGEAAQGTDPDLKAFATATLPTLKEHLSMIEAAQK
jgi:putative membrane protein